MTGSPAWFDRPGFAAFEEIWFVDFEFISRPGERPDVLCLCAYEIRTGRRIQLWEDQLGPTPPYRTDDRALFVCFAATAECACHLALGWPLPSKVLDLSPMFRSYINGRVPPPEGKGLVGALRHFGLDTIGGKYKEAMRTRILQGRPYSAEEIARILGYCMSDVVGLPALVERLLPHVDLDIALHWGEFAAVSAAMEHRGIPIDMEICGQLQDKATWAFARDAMVPAIDAQYGVYVRARMATGISTLPGLKTISPVQASTGRATTFPASSTCGAKPSTAWPRRGRSSRHCASCATPATKCDGSNWRSAVTAGIGPCSGRSPRRHLVASLKPRSGSSRRRLGCDH